MWLRLREDFKKILQEATDSEEEGDVKEMQMKWERTLCMYLLYLVGVMLFINKSENYVDVTSLKYIWDLELVSDFAWGAAAFAHLYKELNNGSHYKTSH